MAYLFKRNRGTMSAAGGIMRYLVVVEPTGTGFSAYSPDLPGCVATGRTRQEVEEQMQEAIEFHIDGLREEGHEVPPPTSYSIYVEVPA